MMSEFTTQIETTIQRLNALRPRLDWSDDALMERYWRLHPRFRFVKTAPRRAALLDIGAGSGGMAHWKLWGEPKRRDIRFYGVDTARGEHAGLYRGWESLDLDQAMPGFHGITFDACVMSHVIEHVRDPSALLAWIAGHLHPGGLIYVEWPGAASLAQPPREALLPHGIDIMITNFFDDATHIRPITRADLVGWLPAAGLAVQETGTIDLGDIGAEMLARGLRDGDGFKKLCGYWSTTRWAEWVICGRR
jgi:2-polyprenyl-3-methyl-5-hydroxy-6-metoxy-1,4-benzoquinol methylase